MVANVLANLDEPFITHEVEEKILPNLTALNHICLRLPESTDTYDGLPFKMWESTTVCHCKQTSVSPLSSMGTKCSQIDAQLNMGTRTGWTRVEIETFYTPEEAKTRAAELRSAGYTCKNQQLARIPAGRL